MVSCLALGLGHDGLDALVSYWCMCRRHSCVLLYEHLWIRSASALFVHTVNISKCHALVSPQSDAMRYIYTNASFSLSLPNQHLLGSPLGVLSSLATPYPTIRLCAVCIRTGKRFPGRGLLWHWFYTTFATNWNHNIVLRLACQMRPT